jgi:hypothetical protein
MRQRWHGRHDPLPGPGGREPRLARPAASTFLPAARGIEAGPQRAVPARRRCPARPRGGGLPGRRAVRRAGPAPPCGQRLLLPAMRSPSWSDDATVVRSDRAEPGHDLAGGDGVGGAAGGDDCRAEVRRGLRSWLDDHDERGREPETLVTRCGPARRSCLCWSWPPAHASPASWAATIDTSRGRAGPAGALRMRPRSAATYPRRAMRRWYRCDSRCRRDPEAAGPNVVKPRIHLALTT